MILKAKESISHCHLLITVLSSIQFTRNISKLKSKTLTIFATILIFSVFIYVSFRSISRIWWKSKIFVKFWVHLYAQKCTDVNDHLSLQQLNIGLISCNFGMFSTKGITKKYSPVCAKYIHVTGVNRDVHTLHLWHVWF